VASPEARSLARRRSGPLGGGLPRAFQSVQFRPRLLSRRHCGLLGLDRRDGGGAWAGASGLGLGHPSSRLIGRGPLLGGRSRRLSKPPSHRLQFGRPRRLYASQRSQCFALGLLCRPHRTELLERLGECPLRLGESPGQRHVTSRHRRRNLTPLDGQVRLGGREFRLEPATIAQDSGGVAGRSRVPQLQLGEEASSRLVRSSSLGFRRGSRGEVTGDRRGPRLRLAQRGQRRVGVNPARAQLTLRVARSPGSLLPARTGQRDDRPPIFASRRLPGSLLLGLGRQPPGLGPQLGQNVLDAGQVRLGFGQLVFGPGLAPLVPPHPSDLLEQRPPLLGPQRQRLIDHSLADEQESVVGEMGRIEEIDQVLQPNALLVEQIVVLARAKEPPS